MAKRQKISDRLRDEAESFLEWMADNVTGARHACTEADGGSSVIVTYEEPIPFYEVAWKIDAAGYYDETLMSETMVQYQSPDTGIFLTLTKMPGGTAKFTLKA